MFIPAGSRGLFEGNHVIKQQLQKVLRDRYNIASIGSNEFIKQKTPVQILSTDAHQRAETAFHKRLNAWHDEVLSDWNLDNIIGNPDYDQAYKVLDEYLKFLKAYPEYADMAPVVRAFAKVHGIPITE